MGQNIALNNSTQHHLNTNNDTHSRSPVLADHNHQELSKEQTVTQHTNPDARQSERPLTTRNNGKRYRTNPTNVYISKWKDGFQRFWACGASQHRFATCKQKHDPQARKIFWQELWTHALTTRTRKSGPIPKRVLDTDPKYTSIVVSGSHTLQTIHGDQ